MLGTTRRRQGTSLDTRHRSGRGSGASDLRAFVAVAELGSFSRAAEQLGIAPSSISQTIRNLEARLGIRLLQRTTRSVALTEAGQQLLLRVRPALAELDAALADVGQLRTRPAGMVRVRCLKHAYQRHVGPILAAFHAAYPEIKLDITVDDAIVDLVPGGYDVGFTLGEVLEKDMVAVRVGGELRQIAVASPDYLARYGTPMSPKDLHDHRCIRWRWPGNTMPYNWEFCRDGAWFEVEVDGPLIVSEQRLAVEAAMDGVGIAFWAEDMMRPLIKQGRLVALLEDWSASFPGFYLCYPQQRQMAPALRAFIDFVKDQATSR
ncbi:MAG TPA: LysR family transcriptional regulator [Geminicoccus sp.]|jgi:DNA-binding transcriptional LysR family regulator|uniref:LysR family transcriptional regulator n=1 Tax=Geminicoccus sp. TaxID=2024832 RepID=UPI002E37FF31|nr:LysR family transcriptional regulator [Geminicoccus sp.]HEX2524784.1 LysR family transcriptional regulator [Geminicoccus sp.]